MHEQICDAGKTRNLLKERSTGRFSYQVFSSILVVCVSLIILEGGLYFWLLLDNADELR